MFGIDTLELILNSPPVFSTFLDILCMEVAYVLS